MVLPDKYNWQHVKLVLMLHTRKLLDFLPGFLRLHVLFIFLQPCIIWSAPVNAQLLRVSHVRLYVLMRFYMMNNEMENSRFKRIMNQHGISHDRITVKIAFSNKYFILSACSILAFLVFGLGTIIDENTFGNGIANIFHTIYFVFITISTTGYGDTVAKDSDNKLINCTIIIVGICVNSLLTVTVLGVFRMNQQEENAYYLRQRLELTEKQQ